MTYEELRDEAERQGFKLVKKGRPKPKTVTYDRCKECKYLKGEKSSVGIECINPNKEFLRPISRYKAPSAKACKLFEKEADI